MSGSDVGNSSGERSGVNPPVTPFCTGKLTHTARRFRSVMKHRGGVQRICSVDFRGLERLSAKLLPQAAEIDK